MSQTLFEVHTLKGGQWLIDSTYPGREEAIEVAKGLYGEKRFDGVKVIKDTLDPATEQSKAVVVYDTSKASKRKTARSAAGKSKKPELKPAAGRASASPSAARARRPGANKDVSVAIKATLWLALIVGGALGALLALSSGGALFSKWF